MFFIEIIFFVIIKLLEHTAVFHLMTVQYQMIVTGAYIASAVNRLFTYGVRNHGEGNIRCRFPVLQDNLCLFLLF